jgi:hypothetical protein
LLQQGRLFKNQSWVNFYDLHNEVLQLVKFLADCKEITIKVPDKELRNINNLEVAIDAKRTQQILMKLFFVAIHLT